MHYGHSWFHRPTCLHIYSSTLTASPTCINLPPTPMLLLLLLMCCSIVHHGHDFLHGRIYSHHLIVVQPSAEGGFETAWLSEAFRKAHQNYSHAPPFI